MNNKLPPSKDLPRATLAALLLAVFTVSVGYGVVLPLLPTLIERLLGDGSGAVQISRHTGLMTAIYALGLFLFAPMWGQLSDRLGRRNILLFGLLGFGITMLIFSFIESLGLIYAERFLSGIFASTVAPVAMATIADSTDEQGRGRKLAFVSMSSIIGFMLGPMLGVLVTRFTTNFIINILPAGSVALPLVATALLAFLVILAVAVAVPSGRHTGQSKKVVNPSGDSHVWIIPKLLILTFIVSVGIGVFEVGLALRGKQELGLTPYQIALMFTECSLVMFLIQAVIFSPWVKPDTTRWLILPMLVVLAGGLFYVPRASDFATMLVVVGAVAASAGILSPILTYWISRKAGSAQGWQLGKQTAAASLGVTMGSAAGGLLFNVVGFPGASFILAAALTVLGFILSLRLPHWLVPRDLENQDSQQTSEGLIRRGRTQAIQAVPSSIDLKERT